MIKNKNIDNTVEMLVKSFFKGSLPNLSREHVKNMTWDIQEKFLYKTVHSSLLKKYPISSNFSRLYFKRLIECLEPEQEVHDDIYEYLCSVMENDSEHNFRYCHYLIDNSMNNIITIKETKNMVINGTTGLRTWEAALMLSDWALSNKELFSNKTLLELGSGVGFTGIAIAKHCDVKCVVMTDCHDEVLETMHNNIQINFSKSTIEHTLNSTIYKNEEKSIGLMKLDWNDFENLPQNLQPDIIIGADILYDPSIFQSLIAVFNFFHNRNEDINIYIANVIRNIDTFDAFLKLLEFSNFKHTTVPLTRYLHVEWDENLARCMLKISRK